MTDPDLDPDLETSLLDDDDDDFEKSAAPGTSHSGDDFEDLDEPEVLCGLYWGHISDVKDDKYKADRLIVEFKSEEADASQGETVSAWISVAKGRANLNQRSRMFKIAVYAGVPTIPRTDGKPGKRLGAKFYAAKNKRCLFVVTVQDYQGDRSSSLAWGMPKAAESPEWKAFAAEQNDGKGFSAEQIKALKDSPGIIAPKYHKLFG